MGVWDLILLLGLPMTPDSPGFRLPRQSPSRALSISSLSFYSVPTGQTFVPCPKWPLLPSESGVVPDPQGRHPFPLWRPLASSAAIALN